MNAGYVSLWLLLVVMILNATGWKKFITDDLPWPLMLLFAAGWLSLSPLQLPVGPLMIEWTFIWLIAWAILALFAVADRYHFIYLLFGIGLIALIWFWIRKIYTVDPVFVFIHPKWDAPLVCGLFAGRMSYRFKDHFALLALSIGFGELMLHTVFAVGGKAALIGDGRWWDGWISAMVMARFIGGLSLMLAKIRAKLRWGGLPDRGGGSS